MNEKQKLGKLGEDFAAQVLLLDGYQILERNYSCKDGEIDLIAEREGDVIFVEVKTRRSLRFGTPAEAVNVRKQQRLRCAARQFLAERRQRWRGYSFQVVEVCIEQIFDAF